MQFICDTPCGKTWFRIETAAEAAQESELMRHAVEKYFLAEQQKARASYRPVDANAIERDIGLKDHVRRSMPMFLTLRDGEGAALATAMLPPERDGDDDERGGFRVIVVGPANADPYVQHGPAIEALGDHLWIDLCREDCYPYR